VCGERCLRVVGYFVWVDRCGLVGYFVWGDNCGHV